MLRLQPKIWILKSQNASSSNASPLLQTSFRNYFGNLPEWERIHLEEQSVDFNEKRKRKLAMLIGYAGTGFKGNQFSPLIPHEENVAIEGVLYKAIFDSGLVLPSNFNNSLKQIGWSRSSRTDKGVHSLSTIVSFKAEMTKKQEAVMNQDTAGLSLANVINKKLPENIRVLSAQKVPNSYTARSDTVAVLHYEYLIPFSSLRKDEKRVKRFHEILQKFLGTQSHHNFAEVEKKKRKQIDFEEEEEEENIEETSETASVPTSETTPLQVTPGLTLYGKEYMRNIYKSQIDRVLKLGGEQFFVVSISGQGFAKHQIRKMIGGALGTALDILPNDFIELCLNTDQSIPVPLAPGQPLVLMGADVRTRKDFEYVNFNQQPINVIKDKFKKDFLYPHLRDLIVQPNGESIFDPFLEQMQETYKGFGTEYFEKQREAAKPFVEWRTEFRNQKIQKREAVMETLSKLPLSKVRFDILMPDGFITTTRCNNHHYIDQQSMIHLQIGLSKLFYSKQIPIEVFSTVETLSNWIRGYEGKYEAIEAVGRKSAEYQKGP